MTPQLETLLKQIRATQDKLAEQVDALEAALLGEATIGQEAKAALAHFKTAWEKRYRGERYVPNYASEIPACKRMLAGVTLEDLKARQLRYLHDADPFYVKAKHPLGLFEKHLNKYGTGQYHGASLADGEADLFGPVDCGHTPRCRSDAEHTRKQMAELRHGRANGTQVSVPPAGRG